MSTSLPHHRLSPAPSTESWYTVTSNQNETVDSDTSASLVVDLRNIDHPQEENNRSNSNSHVAPEKKKCWICLTEEGEAGTNGEPLNSSRWAKACACSLDAHESCLITWINQSRGFDTSQVMTCPQCKEPYRIEQRISTLYKLAVLYNKRIDRLAPVVIALGAVGGTYIALTAHGWYALCTFCGEDLALRIFSDENWSRPGHVIRLLLGMQFIPLWLLASRTRYFDAILPFIPLTFIEQENVEFYPHLKVTLLPTPRHELLPPALTMCILPWLRILYNKFWDKVISPWEKSWEQQGGLGSSTLTGTQENNIVLQINENAQVEGEVARNQPARRRNNGNVLARLDGGEEVVITTSIHTVCRKVVGALLLPDACSLAGLLLGQIPWVKRKIPDRFSRNVIGGIMFLVLKDAASLWFKYSAAKSRRSLRVLDYQGLAPNTTTTSSTG